MICSFLCCLFLLWSSHRAHVWWVWSNSWWVILWVIMWVWWVILWLLLWVLYQVDYFLSYHWSLFLRFCLVFSFGTFCCCCFLVLLGWLSLLLCFSKTATVVGVGRVSLCKWWSLFSSALGLDCFMILYGCVYHMIYSPYVTVEGMSRPVSVPRGGIWFIA